MKEWDCHRGRKAIAEENAASINIQHYRNNRTSHPERQIEAIEARKIHQSNLRLANSIIEVITPGTIFRIPCRPKTPNSPNFKLVAYEKAIDSQHILTHPIEEILKPVVGPTTFLKDAGILIEKDSKLLEKDSEMLDFYLHQTPKDLANQLSVSEEIRQRHCHRI